MVQVSSRLIEVRPEIQSESQEARVYFKSFYGEEDPRPVDLDVKEFDQLLWTRDEDIFYGRSVLKHRVMAPSFAGL